MSGANYAANVRRVNERLGREIVRAMTKAKMTSPELARRAGVGESWVKQVRTGRIQKPDPERLRRIADELGLDPLQLLAMSDQLGAPVGEPMARLDPYAIIQAHTKAMEAQAESFNRLADSIDRAAERVTRRVEDSAQAFEDVVRLLREQQPTVGGGIPPASDRVP